MASDKTFGGCHGRNGRSNRRCNARLPQGCSENTPAGGMNLTASNAEIRFPPVDVPNIDCWQGDSRLLERSEVWFHARG